MHGANKYAPKHGPDQQDGGENQHAFLEAVRGVGNRGELKSPKR